MMRAVVALARFVLWAMFLTVALAFVFLGYVLWQTERPFIPARSHT